MNVQPHRLGDAACVLRASATVGLARLALMIVLLLASQYGVVALPGSTGTPTFTTTTLSSSCVNTFQGDVVDIDGNGAMDVLVGTWQCRKLVIQITIDGEAVLLLVWLSLGTFSV